MGRLMSSVRFSPTFRLFPIPSITDGIGSILDLAGSERIYNVDRTGREADFRAFIADWEAVASDLNAACKQFELSNRERITSA